MSILEVVGALFSVLLLLYIYRHYLSSFARNTVNVPGPTPIPLLGNLFDFGSTSQDIFIYATKHWKKYGNVIKALLGPHNIILTAELQHFEVLLNSNTNITKGTIYKYVVPWLGMGLLTSTGSKWKEHRKIITPTFHFKILEQFVESFNNNGDILIKKLQTQVNGPTFNIYEYINLNTLDIICETALGVSVHAQKSKTSVYVEAIKGMAAVIVKRMFTPWYHSDVLFNLTTWGRKQRKCLSILHSTSDKVIYTRKEENKSIYQENDNAKENDVGMKKKYAFLDLLLQYSKYGQKLTSQEIREEVDTFMFEGHDTTASAITFCLWMLGKHPHIQDMVYDELKMIFGTSDRNSTYQELNAMKYLDCVIKETLRLFPSVPFYSRLLDAPVQFDKFSLPAGTNVVLMPYFLHRNPEIFTDPEKFYPDRFLPENVQGRHPFAYVPFSAGPRNCIGQKFAILEIKSTVSKILRSYKLIADENHNIVLSWEFVLRSANGVFLRIENRK